MPNRQARTYALTQKGYDKVTNALDKKAIPILNRASWLAAKTVQCGCSVSDDTIRFILFKEKAVKEDSIRAIFKVLGLHGEIEVDWVFTRNKSKHQREPEDTTQIRVLSTTTSCSDTPRCISWGEAPDVSIFFGRETELQILEKWIVEDKCRLVCLLGMGGFGKTALSVKLTQRIQDQFKYVIWRSLREAPPIDSILADLIKILSNQQEVNFPNSIGEKITKLIEYLKNSACLLILDNIEAILQGDTQTEQYLDGYEEYGTLLKRISESHHISCLIITSREKTKEISLLEGNTLPTRSFLVRGLSASNVKEIIKTKDLIGSDKDIQEMTELYNGNPLLLKIVAGSIKDVCSSKISDFLSQDIKFFGENAKVLEEQFQRLSELERDIMYWLAVYREPVSFKKLEEGIFPVSEASSVFQSLDTLKRRDLIDTISGKFTLQNYVMEYITDRLIRKIKFEIISKKICLLNNYALIEANTKDYIRENQIRKILNPLVKDFNNLEEKILNLLNICRNDSNLSQGYTTGNIINILGCLKSDLSGLNLSGTIIRQAYLSNVSLYNVDLSNSQIINSIFTQILGTILSVAFSINGKFLAHGDANREIYIWNMENGKQLFLLAGHTGWIWSVAFSPVGNILASGCNNQLRIWDIKSGKCQKILQNDYAGINSLAFTPNGKLLASASCDKTIRLWDLESGQYQLLEKHLQCVRAVKFSPDGQFLASGSDDKIIYLWNVKLGICGKTLSGHSQGIRALDFDIDGRFLASSSSDQTIKLWDVKNGQCIKTIEGHSSQVRSIAYSPNSKTIASCSYDKTVKLWSVETGQCLQTWENVGNGLESISFNSDGKTIAVGSYEQAIRFLDIESGKCYQTWQGCTYWIWAIDFSPDGTILASGGDDQALRLWDVNTGLCFKTFQISAGRIWSIAFSRDGKTIAIGTEDHKVRLWNMGSEKYSNILEGHTARIRSVKFSSNGKFLASSSEDLTIKIWDAKTGEFIKNLKGHKDYIWSVSFNPNDESLQNLASCSLDKTIKIWNIDSGDCLRTINNAHDNWVLSVAFSPDGCFLVSSSADLTIKIWDTKTGKLIETLLGHKGWIWSVTFSPDGRFLASGSYDSTIKLWDFETKQCITTLSEHKNWVRPVVFSSDGQTLASGSEDETIKIWNLKRYKCHTLKPLKPYEGLNIKGVKGLTDAQWHTLKALGAIEE